MYPCRKTRNPFRRRDTGLMGVLVRQSARSRVVQKRGEINTVSPPSLADGKSHRLFRDLFISILDLSWCWIFLLFAAGFFLSWLAFALAWYLTFLQHGDFDAENRANDSFVPCASAIEDFASCFLFSVETQHTIGYGGRYSRVNSVMVKIALITQFEVKKSVNNDRHIHLVLTCVLQKKTFSNMSVLRSPLCPASTALLTLPPQKVAVVCGVFFLA